MLYYKHPRRDRSVWMFYVEICRIFFTKAIDFDGFVRYIEHRKGATDRRSALVSYKEVTALWLGRLLLFYNLNDQTNYADKYKTKLKQLCICDHIDHPLS